MTSRTTTRTRTWLRRLDAYTLEVFNPGLPYRPRRDRLVEQG
jgi:hypothetical protein